MRGLGIMLLIVALMFVGMFAFGSVNQYENETGLTVETLMLSLTEKTVEARGVDFVEMAYAEFAIAISNDYNEASILIIPCYNDGALMEVNPANLPEWGGVAVCLKFPYVRELYIIN